MKKFYHSLAAVLLMTITLSIGAQTTNNSSQLRTKLDYAAFPYWIEMMQDHSVNFYEVQKAFNAYFEDKEKGKGTGWKQFKRWEYFMEQRVYPGGERINTSQAWNEMKKFKASYPLAKSLDDNTWTPLGPTTSQNITGHWNPGLGRINVIARDPNDANILYIGDSCFYKLIAIIPVKLPGQAILSE